MYIHKIIGDQASYGNPKSLKLGIQNLSLMRLVPAQSIQSRQLTGKYFVHRDRAQQMLVYVVDRVSTLVLFGLSMGVKHLYALVTDLVGKACDSLHVQGGILLLQCVRVTKNGIDIYLYL